MGLIDIMIIIFLFEIILPLVLFFVFIFPIFEKWNILFSKNYIQLGILLLYFRAQPEKTSENGYWWYLSAHH